MLVAMPPKQRPEAPSAGSSASGTRRAQPKRCKALTTSGSQCQRPVVPGLSVCRSHGGATAASVRTGKKAQVSQRAAELWGLSEDTSGISIVAELNKLARNKMTDIVALRIELGSNPKRYYGLLTSGKDVKEEENGEDIYVTVTTKKTAGVHPLVQELHKAEQELIQILRLLQEVTGGSSEGDTKRIRIQTAREAARLAKAFPGISVDEIAAEVNKRAG